MKAEEDSVSAIEPWLIAESVAMVGFEDGCFIGEESVEPQDRDLEERTACFGEAMIDFCRQIPRDAITKRILSQLVGCSTSIGANYCEAQGAVSKKEFALRTATCRKEAHERKFFIRMAARAFPTLKSEARKLWIEADELHKIMAWIHNKVRA